MPLAIGTCLITAEELQPPQTYPGIDKDNHFKNTKERLSTATRQLRINGDIRK